MTRAERQAFNERRGYGRAVKAERIQGYYVHNLMNHQSWQGEARNAKEAYSHMTINPGDVTQCRWGYQSSVKEW